MTEQTLYKTFHRKRFIENEHHRKLASHGGADIEHIEHRRGRELRHGRLQQEHGDAHERQHHRVGQEEGPWGDEFCSLLLQRTKEITRKLYKFITTNANITA